MGTIRYVPVKFWLQGRKQWRYIPDPGQGFPKVALACLKTNGLPIRLPLPRMGHAVFVLGSAGYTVEFQPVPGE